MKLPKGTKFKEGFDEETGQKIKIAILPDGTELKFFTDEELNSIQKFFFEIYRTVFKANIYYNFLRMPPMGDIQKFVFTRPKQIPLFEEKDDGTLEEYKKE